MEDKYLNSISKQVTRQFPEVAGTKPRVVKQSKNNSKSAPATYLITFRGKSQTPDGKSINRIVRVTASETGKIIKLSTSR
jgi:rRNA maturation endonuclease Nob1